MNAFVNEIKPRILAVLPRDKNPDRYLATVDEYLLRNPDLFGCEKESLAAAIVDAALLGLELGPPLDLSVILPFTNQKTKKSMAELVVQYRGDMLQAYRTGRVSSIQARPVYEADEFEFRLGTQPLLNHRPFIGDKRGPLKYAYATARLRDGEIVAEVITRHDADRARADSSNGKRPDSLWHKREADMWVKTALKKLVRRLPQACAVSIKGGHDPPDPLEYQKLIHAVCISPDFYQIALKTLRLDFPLDSHSIRAVLDAMRNLYKAQNRPQTKDEN